jgi:regulatory protein
VAAIMGFDQPSLKGRALRLLGQREHSRFELERKLRPHEVEPGELALALDDLQAKGFINEQVLESVVHRRAPRLGALRVRQELQAKGLAPEAVAQAVADLQGSEVERAREVWRRKFGAPAEDTKSWAKQMRFLAARGFGGDTIRRVVKSRDGDSDD